MSFYKYMAARRNAFTVYNRYIGSGNAYEMAMDVIDRANLDVRRDVGLRAEIDFYHQYRDKYSLTLAEDSGDSCDFAGFINGQPVRIDVTTNVNFKKVAHYTKPSCAGREYFLAVRTSSASDFQLLEAWRLGSVSSPCLSNVDAIPLVVIYPEETSRGGSPDGWNKVKDVAYCHSCQLGHVLRSTEDFRIPTLSEYMRQVDEWLDAFHGFEGDCEMQIAARNENRKYLSSVYHFLKDYLGHEILAIGEYQYITTSPDGDGYYGVGIVKRSPCVESWLPDLVDLDDSF